jgi:hypothetical protein
MDDQENYDPGPVNTIVDRVRDHGRRGDPDEESMPERMSGSVEGIAMGGEADGNDAATRVTTADASFGDRGAVGEAQGPDIRTPDDPSTRETADPDTAAGAFGV